MSARPFFEQAGSQQQRARRLLLISFHFPPDTTIGARRWEQMCHTAAERGWGLDIVTCQPAQNDVAGMEALPAGVRVYGVPDRELLFARVEHAIWRFYRRCFPLPAAGGDASRDDRNDVIRATAPRRSATIRRSAVWAATRTPRALLRAYWSWLDIARGRRWARAAARVASQVVERGAHQAVISSGPPHMAHHAGREIAAAIGIPLVIDMRDPWTLQEELPEAVASPVRNMLVARNEALMIRDASLVVANTELARRAMEHAYPEHAAKFIAVMNGADEEALPPRAVGSRFTIGFAGTIYVERDPRCLFRGVRRFLDSRPLSPQEFGIDLMLTFDATVDIPIAALAREEGVGDYVRTFARRPRAEALAFLASAPMLAVFTGQNRLAIPAKIFEYMRFQAWLLVLADPEFAPALILRDTTADVIAPEDSDAIAGCLAVRYREFCGGVVPAPVAVDDRFSRRRQAAILFDAIDSCVGQRPPIDRTNLTVRS